MPESPDPRNTFEVTVPPLLGQDQTFHFTFHPACPGPVVSSTHPRFTIVLLTRTYQTVKISRGPHPTGPVDLPRVSICTPAPSTPPRVSVGVSPICVQRTPPLTLVSRGLSPVPIENLLPSDIAAFFASTQMQLESTQVSSGHSLTRPTDSDIISLTGSELDSEKAHEMPCLQYRNRARSPEIVAETQMNRIWAMDALVCPHSPLLMYVYAHSKFLDGPNAVGTCGRVKA